MTRFPIWSTINDYSTQTYHSKHRYNIHKHINTNANAMKIQCYNNQCIGNI